MPREQPHRHRRALLTSRGALTQCEILVKSQGGRRRGAQRGPLALAIVFVSSTRNLFSAFESRVFSRQDEAPWPARASRQLSPAFAGRHNVPWARYAVGEESGVRAACS